MWLINVSIALFKYHTFTAVINRCGSRGVVTIVQASLPAGRVLQHPGGGAYEDDFPGAPPSSSREDLGHLTNNYRHHEIQQGNLLTEHIFGAKLLESF